MFSSLSDSLDKTFRNLRGVGRISEKNIADADTLAAIADSTGLPGQQLVAASLTDSVAATYLRNTEEAIAAQVFGVPWFRVNGENFWGQDRLEFVELALAAA